MITNLDDVWNWRGSKSKEFLFQEFRIEICLVKEICIFFISIYEKYLDMLRHSEKFSKIIFWMINIAISKTFVIQQSTHLNTHILAFLLQYFSIRLSFEKKFFYLECMPQKLENVNQDKWKKNWEYIWNRSSYKNQRNTFLTFFHNILQLIELTQAAWTSKAENWATGCRFWLNLWEEAWKFEPAKEARNKKMFFLFNLYILD